MYNYSAYGFSIHSQLLLPELEELDSVPTPVDVVVRLDHVENRPDRFDQGGSWFNVSPRKSQLVWDGMGTFLIRDGHEVIVDPAPGSDEAAVRQAFLGPAMGLLLLQRGLFPLHASSVAVAGKGIAFAGATGSGKSTLAAQLHSQGHDLVSDDITAVELDADPLLIHPGFPRFRLWPESVTAFGETSESLPRLHPDTEKRLVRVESGFADSPVPMSSVFLLAEDRSESIEPLSPRDGVLEMLRLCYNVQLVQAAVGAPVLLNHCARLADRIAFFILKRRRSLTGLSDLGLMVEKHLASLG